MRCERISLETEYIIDQITHNGFDINTDVNTCGDVDVDHLINAKEFTDTEYRCDCGAFIGGDLVGHKCPLCNSEISLHSLNFTYTGWLNIGEHKLITPVYYNLLKKTLGNNMLRFILGDYKDTTKLKYDDEDETVEEKPVKKRQTRLMTDDLSYIKKKIPKAKHIYEGLGHDEFYRRFEEIMLECTPNKNMEMCEKLIKEKYKIFTSKIPIYSTAFRPVSKTSETMFYPKINRWYAMMTSIYCRLDQMVLDREKRQALNYMQNNWIEAADHLVDNEVSSKTGLVRSEIIGGTFSFSARGVIILDISLRTDEVDLPFSMMVIAYQYKIAHRLAVRYNWTLEEALIFTRIHSRDTRVTTILDDIICEGQWIFMLREPTNNLGSIGLFRIRSYKMDDNTISLPLDVLTKMNADFDGDALAMCFLDKSLVPEFRAFHYSCMTDYITGENTIDCKEWMMISMGLMTE